MESPAQTRMRAYLQLVATGPELSKSLDRTQARDAMDMILNGEIDPVRSALFLIALRMKRETDDENLGILDSLTGRVKTATANFDDVIAVADPFNGYLRSLPATPFLPAVLSACGLPAYIHGMHLAGPKYGMTASMILRAAGIRDQMPVDEVVKAMSDRNIGWGYLDQSQYIPTLHDLVGLRDTMVKRCCISTLEVVLKPISGFRKTMLMTGFVHKAYPPVYHLLAKHAGFDAAMIVRGVEGGCIPSLSQVSRYFGYQSEEQLKMYKLSPSVIGIQQNERAVSIPDRLKPLMKKTAIDNTAVLDEVILNTVEKGMAALNDKPGPMKDSLVYAAAIVLKHLSKAENLISAADMVRQAISSGSALAKFEAMKN